MVRNFNHQKTIGIVGATSDSQAFILKANKLGFTTYLLCQTETEANEFTSADQTFIGALSDEVIHEEFLMHSDLLVYFDYGISSKEIEEAKKSVVVPQDEELLSIARDRVLQKAFKESLSVNIAPYATVVKEEDITEGIRSIGYPAVLRTNFVNPDREKQSYFIYEESDIEEAADLLKYGTCVLESWIVAEHELSISVAKTSSGRIELFPIVRKEYRKDRLANVRAPFTVEAEIEEEIERVAILLADNISFRGVITIDFLVSPAEALYVGSIYPYPNVLSRYSEALPDFSASEIHLRAIASLPVPKRDTIEKEFVYVPIYWEHKEAVDELLTIYPHWDFTFYPLVKGEIENTKRALGHILIETENVEKTLDMLRDYGF